MNTIYIYIYIYTHTNELTIQVERIESNLYKSRLLVLSEPSRIYTNMSHLIYEKIIVFMTNLFIFQIKTKSNFNKPNQTEFASSRLICHCEP